MKSKTDFNSSLLFFIKKGPVRWALLVLAIIISIALKFYFFLPNKPRVFEIKEEWLACQKNDDCVAIYNGCADVAVNKTYALEIHKAFINWHNIEKMNCEVNSSATMNVVCKNSKCTGK